MRESWQIHSNSNTRSDRLLREWNITGGRCVRLLEKRSCDGRKINDEDEEQETQMGMEISEECVCVKDVRWKRNKLIAIKVKS